MTALREPEVTPDSEQAPRPGLEGEAAAAIELAQLLTSSVYFGSGVPRGNGRTVLVIPGFLGNDEYLLLLRGWLRRIGYDSRASGIAFNWGTPSSLVRGLVDRVDRIAADSEQRIILVGHSLGGLFARALLLQRPERIAHAICLGSPLTGDPRSSSHPLVGGLGRALLQERGGRPEDEAFERYVLDSPLPASVRLTSLYTRHDAVVDWHSCLDPDPRATHAEVHGTHTGLAWNAEVYRLLATALASTGI
jgi:triacylglycerol lipase